MKNIILCALAVTLVAGSAVALPLQTAPNFSILTFSDVLTTSANLFTGQGAPMPTCYPGKNCGDESQQTIAGQGAPMPTCYPGKNCGDESQQTIAGQGAPMPTCYPGKNCGDESQQTIARAEVPHVSAERS